MMLRAVAVAVLLVLCYLEWGSCVPVEGAGQIVDLNQAAFNNCLIEIGKRVIKENGDQEVDREKGDYYREIMRQEPCVDQLLQEHPVPGLNRQGRQDEAQIDLYCFFCPAEKPEELYLNFARCFTGTNPTCCMCIFFTAAHTAITYMTLTASG